MKRNFLYTYSLLALLFIAFGASNVLAQNDEIVISPNRGSSDQCGFNMTVKNKNGAHLTIDQVRLTILSLDATAFTDASAPFAPAQWSAGYSDKVDSFIAVVAPIAVGATQSGFRFAYYSDGSEFDNPVAIKWETMNQDNVVSSGTINPICLTFQSMKNYDTATSTSSMNGPDPCFSVVMLNRNSFGLPIKYLRLQLQTIASGTLRPSKITPPAGWVVDSVNSYNAYFHTDQNIINPGEGSQPFTICLRGNPSVTKHNIAWHAYDEQHTLIDRDTLFNLSGTATSAPSDVDELSVTPVSGCLYTVNVKNYHVSNLQPPGPITKLVLKMQTSGVQFASAPSAPPKWTKTVTNDSIVFTADSANHGVQSGTISSAFRFSASGATTSDFIVAWQTYRPQGLLTSGQLTTKCTVEAPRADSAFVSPTVNNCSFKLTVNNSHNTPPSDLSDITISIPDGSGQIIGSSSSAVWNFTNLSTTKIKFTNIGTLQSSGQSQDIVFTLSPKTPGQNIDLTWSTFEQGNSTAIFTGKVPISCTPIVTVCDTVWKNIAGNIDSCSFDFSVQNRNTADIVLMTLTPTNGWRIDSVGTTLGWTTQLDGGHSTVTFSSDAGLHGGEILKAFGMKFKACNTTDSFKVVAVTHDRNGNTCTTTIPMFCSAGFCDTAIVHGDLLLDPNGLKNLALMPNPTRASSQLVFEARSQQRITVTIFDALGRTISTVTNKILTPGSYEFPINLSQQSSGSYYVRIESPYGLVTKRVVKE